MREITKQPQVILEEDDTKVKSLIIGEGVHKWLKKYCTSKGLKLRPLTEKIITQFLKEIEENK